MMNHQTLPFVSVDNFGDEEDEDLSSKLGASSCILRSLTSVEIAASSQNFHSDSTCSTLEAAFPADRPS